MTEFSSTHSPTACFSCFAVDAAVDDDNACAASSALRGGVWVVSCAGARNNCGLKRQHAYSLLGCCAVPTCGCIDRTNLGESRKEMDAGRVRLRSEDVVDENAALLQSDRSSVEETDGSGGDASNNSSTMTASSDVVRQNTERLHHHFDGVNGEENEMDNARGSTEPAGVAYDGPVSQVDCDSSVCAECGAKHSRYILLRNPTGLSVWKGGIRCGNIRE